MAISAHSVGDVCESKDRPLFSSTHLTPNLAGTWKLATSNVGAVPQQAWVCAPCASISTSARTEPRCPLAVHHRANGGTYVQTHMMPTHRRFRILSMVVQGERMKSRPPCQYSQSMRLYTFQCTASVIFVGNHPRTQTVELHIGSLDDGWRTLTRGGRARLLPCLIALRWHFKSMKPDGI